jgi:shikimate dehydrogenase
MIKTPERVYAVLGDPVSQIRTPDLIAPVFEALGHPMKTMALQVRPEDLKTAVFALQKMPNVAGLGITVPHKVNAITLCDYLTDTAKKVGAVNTIRREQDGTLTGGLFDGEGFIAGLGIAAQKLRGASVLLLGAGGAGRAIAHALALNGIDHLHIIDLNPEAIRITATIANTAAGRQIASNTSMALEDATILINATPLGMKPSDLLPIDLNALTNKTLVADIAALSRRTELLICADALGCDTSDGEDMLNGQLDLVSQFIAGLRD